MTMPLLRADGTGKGLPGPSNPTIPIALNRNTLDALASRSGPSLNTAVEDSSSGLA